MKKVSFEKKVLSFVLDQRFELVDFPFLFQSHLFETMTENLV